MLKPKHHSYSAVIYRQKGMALLILLSVILIAVTAVAVSFVSLNTQSINRAKNTTQALSYSKNILLGYSLFRPATRILPWSPGTLPCPDNDGDGEGDDDQNQTTGICNTYRGLLPYKTLGIERQVDGSGQPLWYVVDRNYVGATDNHNSSHAAALRIDGVPSYAFILIAPNAPLLNQSPVLTFPLNATQFLEGLNADSDLDTYSSLKNATQNDVLLGVTTADFWPPIEKIVLDEVEDLIGEYRTACARFPWAADFNLGNGISIDDRYEGAFPTNFGTGCAIALPDWLRLNWQGQLYYAICNQPPANPPANNCLTFAGSTQTAGVVVIAPGIPGAAQDRDIFSNLRNFFENEDATPNDRLFDLTPGANDNDSLRIISP